MRPWDWVSFKGALRPALPIPNSATEQLVTLGRTLNLSGAHGFRFIKWPVGKVESTLCIQHGPTWNSERAGEGKKNTDLWTRALYGRQQPPQTPLSGQLPRKRHPGGTRRDQPSPFLIATNSLCDLCDSLPVLGWSQFPRLCRKGLGL